MTERLTKRINERIIQISLGWAMENVSNTAEEDEVLFPAIDKLAHYEDLEEQGRLVVLPEKLDPKRLLNIIADLVCPRYVGLEDWGHDKEKCPSAGCNECWEMALKGE